MINIEKIRKEKSIKELIEFSIINIDKPTGPTSFGVSSYIKKALKLNKTSHFGTLDPQVTGVLPVALGRACRLNEYFMHRNKTYIGIMRLHREINDETLNSVISRFIGKITQMPPVKSRVKRAERVREIISFKILERTGKDILFETEVQAGTYIRKLCDDMGKEIGGAHMLELRRTKAGLFSEPCVNLYDFDKAIESYKRGNDKLLRNILVPAEILTTIMPSVQVNKKVSLKPLLTGKPLMKNDLSSNITDVKENKFILLDGEKIIGIYRKSNEGNIIARPEFVLN